MVKVELIFGAADDAFPTIPFPNLHLDRRGNQPAALSLGAPGSVYAVCRFDCGQLELEYPTSTVVFLPSIDELEDTVVRPDSLADLFVDSYRSRSGASALVSKFPPGCAPAD